MDVLLILSLGIGVNLIIGLVTGSLGWADWLSSIGEGVGGMGSLIIVTLLAGGMMALIRAGGGLDWLVGALTRRLASPAASPAAREAPSVGDAPVGSETAGAAPAVTRRQRRGAELSIAALVSLANLCTANNTIAIITVGGIAKDVSDRFGLDRRRVASILDTFSCFVQGLIPYGAQLLMASGLAGVGAAAIIRYLYYPFALGLVALAAIFLTGRKTVVSGR
jgi:Na+/H+ antiporter NhaC